MEINLIISMGGEKLSKVGGCGEKDHWWFHKTKRRRWDIRTEKVI